MAILRTRNELEKEGTNKKKSTDAVLGNEKKHGTLTKRSRILLRAPYDKIREALEELEAISHPDEEQV
jgi:hypothetical protein